jgi:hypothetical protein
VNRLCVFCKHFYLDMGCSDWSDTTPGEDAVIKCDKGYWVMCLFQDEEDYRRRILYAAKCKDWDPVENWVEEKESVLQQTTSISNMWTRINQGE